MLSVAGGVGIGLVWGWLAARRARAARWPLRAWLLLAVAIQALLVLALASPRALGFFAAGGLAGGLVCRAWLHALAARYGDPSSSRSISE